jgi:hypothetical protein
MAVSRPGWDPGPPQRPKPWALPAHVAGFIIFSIIITLLTYFASTSVVYLCGTFAGTTRPHVAAALPCLPTNFILRRSVPAVILQKGRSKSDVTWPLWRTGNTSTLQTERTNSNGIIAHTVRPPKAAATSRPSVITTTPKSYPVPISGQRYKLGVFGKLIINDMMGVGGAAAETGVAHPALYVLSPNSFPSTLSSPLWRTVIAATLQTERTNSNGTFVDTVRPPAAAATSRPSVIATTPNSYTAPISGQRYKLGVFGKLIINDMMGVGGAAAAARASRPAIATPKPPLRARFHCTGPSHHDGHYEKNEMHSFSHPDSGYLAGREL